MGEDVAAVALSGKTFGSVEHAIFAMVRRWAIRRHPRKSKRWIINKYNRRIGGRRWNFHGAADGRDLLLFRAARISIQRHINLKIPSAALKNVT